MDCFSRRLIAEIALKSIKTKNQRVNRQKIARNSIRGGKIFKETLKNSRKIREVLKEVS
jgi:hypothetical protein